MRKLIFTTIFGDYDELQQAPEFKSWDTVLFTDTEPKDAKGWDLNIIKTDDPKKTSRYVKICIHKLMPSYDIFCHIDGNMILIMPPPSEPIWGLHRGGRGLYSEAKEVIRLGKDSSDIVNSQVNRYRSEGISGRINVTENGFHVRRNNKLVNRMHELWWEEVKKGSYRDQISMPFIREKYQWNPDGLVKDVVSRKYWKFSTWHNNSALNEDSMAISTVMVHHITPASADKNIGRAYNELIKGLPDDDYVVCRDIDTIPPDHISFIQLCDQIAKAGEYDLVSCMTNRLGLEYQLFEGRFSTDFNFMSHYNIAKYLAETYGAKIVPTTRTVGGVMLMMKVSMWRKIGGLAEGTIRGTAGVFFDYDLCQKVLKAQGKIGIAKGVYLFHNYRIWSKERFVKRDTKHLN